MKKVKLKLELQYNSPVILTFFCFQVHPKWLCR